MSLTRTLARRIQKNVKRVEAAFSFGRLRARLLRPSAENHIDAGREASANRPADGLPYNQDVCDELMRKCSAQARELIELKESELAALENARHWENRCSQLERDTKLRVNALNHKIDALWKELHNSKWGSGEPSAHLDMREALTY